jgi:hypothetical protein
LVGTWDDKNHVLYRDDKTFPPAFLVSGVVCRGGGSGGPVFYSNGSLVGIMKGFVETGECLVMGIQPLCTAFGQIVKGKESKPSPGQQHP